MKFILKQLYGFKKLMTMFLDFFCIFTTIMQIPLVLFFLIYNSINTDFHTMIDMAEVFTVFELISIFIIVLSSKKAN